MSSSGIGRYVHSLMLSIQHFLYRPRRRQPSKVPCRMVLERLSWRVTCPDHACFRFLTVARGGSRGPTRKLILLRTQSLVFCSEQEKVHHAFCFESLDHLFRISKVGSVFHSRGGWRFPPYTSIRLAPSIRSGRL